MQGETLPGTSQCSKNVEGIAGALLGSRIHDKSSSLSVSKYEQASSECHLFDHQTIHLACFTTFIDCTIA